ncbi:non-ribosomal peptide synthase/polyketide synthase [Sorangium sp. So ce1389]|uniref:non-ribosomal peptide synthetase n=1 Tax=Sorangium sp. So ce1389 TaxID=3133336 RepID=UPI003F60E225
MDHPRFSPVTAPTTLVELLEARASAQPEVRGFTFLAGGEAEGEHATYRELDRRARAIAAELQQRGAAGERALLLYPPGLEYIAAFFGCLYAGVVAVPMYPPSLARPERSLPRLLAIAASARPRFVLAEARTRALAALAPFQATELQAVDWVATDQLAPGAEDSWRRPEVTADGLAFLQYTSGSTAAPRGVMLTHANLLHNLALIHEAFAHSPESRGVIWLPPYHDMGLIGGILQPLFGGFPVTLMNPVDFLQRPARWLEAISRARATTSGGPNFAYDLCVRKIAPEQRATLDLSSWRVAFNGAEPVRAETLERFAAAFAPCGFRREAFYPTYGLAEATLIVTGGAAGAAPVVRSFGRAALDRNEATEAAAGEVGRRELVGCGRALASQQLAIVDPATGLPRGPGQVGELWVAGPSVARGYFGQPEATRETFEAALAGGGSTPFLRTGDLGFVHDGEVFITGRLKDVIIVRGRNCYPQDIELTAEQSHPALRPGSSAAFAVEVEGEERLVVVAELERPRPDADLEGVIAAVRRAVAEEHELQAHAVVLVRRGEVPKTSSGKVQRRACRAAFLGAELEVLQASVIEPAEQEGGPIALERLAREELAALAPGERLEALRAYLRAHLASALRVGPDALDAEEPIGSLGVDSLAAIELQHRIERDLGAVVPMVAFLQDTTLARLAADLLAQLDEPPGAASPGAPAEPREQEELPLTYGQRALWFLHRLDRESHAYNIARAVRIRAAVDVPSLRAALQGLVDRHPALRTTFADAAGEPTQRVHARGQVALEVEDASAWSEQAVRERLLAEARRPFDLEQGPLLRLSLLELSRDERILLVVVHHIVADLWSLVVMLRDLGQLYAAARAGQAPPPPAAAACSAVDQARWERDLLASPAGAALADHWQRRLAGAPLALELPADRPRPAVQTYRGATHRFRLSAALAEGVKRLARQAGTTAYTALLAAFQVLLHRLTGQTDLVVGTPTTGRGRAALAEQVGYFVNPVVLRADLSGRPTFRAFLGQARATALSAFAHQEYPFALLVERLQPERDPSRSPLFQVAFSLQETRRAGAPGGVDLAGFVLGEAGARIELGELTVESIELEEGAAPFDLALNLAEAPEGLLGAIQYSTDLFDGATVARLAGCFEALLRAIVADPDRSIAGLPLLTAAERRWLLVAQNDTARERPRGASVVSAFADQAARTPDAIAVEDAHGRCTYAALADRAAQLARCLRGLGVGPEARVAVCVERSVDLVVALLGVLMAGGAYVPLDPTHPRERLAFMLADSRPAALLTHARLADALPPLDAPVLRLDADAAAIAAAPAVQPAPPPAGDQLAYVLYTSGSTGRPKGVAVSHAALFNFLAAMQERPGLAADDVVLATTSVSFDIAALELWLPLVVGARAVVVPRDVAVDGARLGAAIADARATVLQATPTTWRLLLEAGFPGAAGLTALCGGEALPRALAEQLLGRCGALWNLYGPTETTIWSTAQRVAPGDGPVSIGQPIDNTTVYVLDADLEPVPVGVPGELYIGGAGLARGYLGRPGLTAERFVPDPHGAAPGGRLYRTGDRARWRAGGELEFLGRYDDQIKLRGFRIEPGEIAARLRRHPGVADAAVALHRADGGEPQLVGYVVPRDGAAAAAALDAGALRAFVGAELPEYMVPAAFVALAALPRSAHGKLDRRALPAPRAEDLAGAAAFAPPRTAAEQRLARAWAELLGRERVGRDDDFFDLGGHSLLAARLAARARRDLGVELPVRAVFEAPTLAALAARVDALAGAAGPGRARPPLEPAPRQGALALSFAQERLWFLEQLAPGTATFNIPGAARLTGALDVAALRASLTEIVRRHEALRTTFALEEGRPVQRIHPAPAALAMDVADLSALPEAARGEELARRMAAEARLPFDIARGPLVRAALVRLGPAEHVLLLTLHHLIADGWSFGVLVRELGAAYGALRAGRAPELPPLPAQYADHAAWQRRWLAEGGALDEQLAYFRDRLAGAPAALALRTDRERPRGPSTGAGRRGARHAVRLPRATTEALRALARREGATLFMALLAGFAALLGRHAGQDDVVIGTDVANRALPEVEGLIGFFVNQLALRVDLSGAPTFRALLGRAREATLGAYAHQDLPFERLVAALAPARDAHQAPLFQVKLVLQNAPAAKLALDGVTIELLEAETAVAKLDLVLLLAETADGLRGAFEYDAALFDPATVARLAGHLGVLLAAAARAPDAEVAALPLLTDVERRQIIEAWGAGGPPEAYVPVHALIAEAARTAPAAEAVSDARGALSFAALEDRSSRLARALRARGVGPGALVGVCLPRSVELVVALLAVLKAGGAYVPLDPTYPAERLAFMIDDAQLPVVITLEDLADELPARWVQFVLLDADEDEIAGQPAEAPALAVGPGALAYVIYTSGSTGRPKGAMVTHGGLSNYVRWAAAAYRAGEGDGAPVHSSVSFDLTVTSLLVPLAAGRPARLVPEGPGVEALAAALREAAAPFALVKLTPVHLDLLAAALGPEGAAGRARALVVGGEALRGASARFWREHAPATRLINEYGPTEAVVGCATFEVGEVDGDAVPIGRPIAGARLHVLGRAGAPAPVGVAGELYIGGVGVARGYLRRPALTAEAFLPDPFGPPGSRLYRTGDLARYRPDGALEFLGRRDAQVKVRGHRVEPGEVEAALAESAAVGEVAVVAHPDAAGDRRLVAYVAPRPGAAIDPEALREQLARVLPAYMVPATIVPLAALPLTPNGKVDRAALPDPAAAAPVRAAGYAAPRTPEEALLAECWADVLGLPRVGIDDAFFAIGGDSLLSVQIVARARAAGIALSVPLLFERQTIRALADALRAAGGPARGEADADAAAAPPPPFGLIAAEDRARLPDDVEDAYPLAALQAGMLFHSALSPESAIYHNVNGVRLRRDLSEAALRRALAGLAARHPVLRTSFRLTGLSEPLQLVHRRAEIPLRVDDLRGLDAGEQRARLRAWFEAEARERFDPARAPLLRVHLHRLADDAVHVGWSEHHAILDGWSVAAMLTELLREAAAIDGGEALEIPAPASSYREFVALERAEAERDEARAHFAAHLGDAAATRLPRWPGEAARDPAPLPREVAVPIAPGLLEGLRGLARAAGVPLKSLLLAAHLRVLAFVAGERDIVTGVLFNGRPETRDGERALGLYLNVLPLRQRLDDAGDWIALARAAFAAERAHLPHRRYPLARLQREHAAAAPETMFNFIHFHVARAVSEAAGVEVCEDELLAHNNYAFAATFALELGSAAQLQLATGVADVPTAQLRAMAGYYLRALEAMVREPRAAPLAVSLLAPEERARLLEAWNATAARHDGPATVGELFAAQAARSPDAAAVVIEGAALTYGELDRRSAALARHLVARGVGPETRVAVCMERSLELVVALLGVTRAGGAYVPIDPGYPAERQAFVLADAGARVLLTQARLRAARPLAGAAAICLDDPATAAAIEREEAAPLPPPALPAHLAYAIYTSGSTGRPKGVMVPHGALANHMRWILGAHGLGPDDALLQKTAIGFDASVWELWAPLLSGGRLVLAPPGAERDPAALADALQRWGITVLQVVPTLLRPLLDTPALRGAAGLRWLFCGGEALEPALGARLREVLPSARLVNLYGPTEAAIDATSAPWRPELAGDTVPIGRPIANTRAYVLDARLEPAPVGAPGELYLAGDGLARGYLGRPDLTAERFLPDPFGAAPGARMYRTGDLARRRPDGELEFVGRADQQVKLRGFRVELGEIEAALLACPAVREAAVVVRDPGADAARLVAFVAPRAEGAPSPGGAPRAGDAAAPLVAELRALLAARLPDPMVPSTFVVLDALPRTASGKIDRRALPEPPGASADLAADAGALAQAAPAEALLAGIFAQVLAAPQVGLRDDFFERGGHSLRAMQLVARVREAFGVELPLRALFEAPTVAGLAARIAALRHGPAAAAAPPLTAAPHDGPAPLSFAQQRLWFLAQWEPDSPAYNVTGAFELTGRLDGEALEASLNDVVQRHASLRTTFVEEGGQPFQVIAPAAAVALARVDLTAIPGAARDAVIERLVRGEAERPFDLARGPLLRAALVRTGDDRHLLVVAMHHIVSDAWSVGVFLREVGAFYAARAAAASAPAGLAPLPIQYADHALWQRRRLEGAHLEAELSYWRGALADLPALALPTDAPRPPVATSSGGRHAVLIPRRTHLGLLALGRRENATLFMTVLAAFQVLLGRLAGQDDVAVGTPVAGRTRVETEGLIGFFVNTLVVRTDLRDNPPFWEALRRTRAACLGAYDHQELPFERLVEELRPARDPSRHPLFQVMFVLQGAQPAAIDLAGVALRSVPVPSAATKFDLTLMLEETERGLEGWIEYSADLFEPATIARLAERLDALLAAVVEAPHRRVADLPLLTGAERRELEAWNETSRPVPPDRGICELFETRAAEAPDAVAVVAGEGTLTYGALNERANRLAHRLRGLGVGPEACVGVCLSRSLELVVGLLAILKAGGAYVPLDPAYPAERLAWMLADARVAALVTEQRLLATLPRIEAPAVCVDRDRGEIAACPGTNPRRSPHGAALAYVIYTSGSTGRPKGVAIAHRSAAARVAWAQGAFAPEELAGVLATTSVCFDLSVFELFVPLCSGGRVLLASDALEVPSLRHAAGATLINTVPSAIGALLRDGALPPSVRTVNLAGEPLPLRLARQLHALPTVARVLNLYGPSEDTTYSTCAEIARDEDREPPIGRPIANTRAYLLDRWLQPVPIGATGELYLGGHGLARGYLGRPGLTAERFLPDPFGREAGARMYRTGDLARRRPDGQLEFLGRADHQVKVRGFRIELGEIEEALRAHETVEEAAVVVRELTPGEPSLVAYLVPASSPRAAGGAAGAIGAVSATGTAGSPRPAAALIDGVRQWLRERLPEHMVPSAFVALDALPRTANGKVDRRALPEPSRERGPEAPLAAPTTPVEQLLAGLFAHVLGVPRVGVRDSFFDLGGHSLLAARLASAVRAAFQVELPLRALFEASSVAELAPRVAALRQSAPAVAAPAATPREGPVPLSFAQRRLWFLGQLDPSSAAYHIPHAVEIRGPLDPAALRAALAAVVARHEALRTTFATRDERPVQIIAPGADVDLPLIDLGALDPAARAAAERQRVEDAARRPFDLSRGPLLRAVLLRRTPTDHLLLLTVHHLVADGWSMGVLVRETAAFYSTARGEPRDSAARGEPRDSTAPGDPLDARAAGLPELPIQYADFALWQHATLEGPSLEAQLAYWRARLAEPPPALQLPADGLRAGGQRAAGASEPLTLDPALARAITALAQRAGVTPFMVLLAAWQLLLGRLSGQEDVVVGTPVAGRARGETEHLIGLFLNTLALRTDLSGDPTFLALLHRVREVCLDAYAHQDVPFERLVEALQPTRDLSRNPLFEVMINLVNTPAAPLELPGLTFAPQDLIEPEAKFSMTLYIEPRAIESAGAGASAAADTLQLRLVYPQGLFTPARIRGVLAQYRHLLEQAAAAPDRTIGSLSLVPPEARALLPDPAEALPEPAHAPAASMFLAWAERAPEQTALRHAGRRWTYGELAERSAALARELLDAGCAPGDVVAVVGPKSFGLYAAMLAVLRSRGVLLCLDRHLPARRRAAMLEAARARYVVAIGPRLAASEGAPGAAPPAVIDVAADSGKALGPALARSAALPRAAGLPAVSPDDPAYVFFTSGTTGAPKGVLGRHKGLSHFLAWQRDTFGVGPRDRAAQLTGLSFDVVLRDVLLPLVSGATLCLPDEPDDLGADRLLPWMAREEISLLHAVPTLAQAWLADAPAGTSLPALRRLFFAGEPLTDALVRRCREVFPGPLQVVNLYGPTETTLAKCFHVVPDDPPPGVQPIGRPLPQTQALVLRAGDRPCGVGEPGEITIRTPFRTLGYLDAGDVDEARRRFVRNALRDDPEDLLYRTGDLGRYRPDGSLEILGRLDHQLKIRGVRVEPDEVAALLARHEGVEACVVTGFRDAAGRDALAAYVVAARGREASASDLRAHLGAHLPAAMLPAAFVFLEALPRTPNGKVDRGALPRPAPGDDDRARPFVAPRTPTEERLAAIWAELLGRDVLSVHDDFFEAGGHSLLATQVAARLRAAFGVELPLRRLFEAPTIAEVSALIEQAQAAGERARGAPIRRVVRESQRVRRAPGQAALEDDDDDTGT